VALKSKSSIGDFGMKFKLGLFMISSDK